MPPFVFFMLHFDICRGHHLLRGPPVAYGGPPVDWGATGGLWRIMTSLYIYAKIGIHNGKAVQERMWASSLTSIFSNLTTVSKVDGKIITHVSAYDDWVAIPIHSKPMSYKLVKITKQTLVTISFWITVIAICSAPMQQWLYFWTVNKELYV